MAAVQGRRLQQASQPPTLPGGFGSGARHVSPNQDLLRHSPGHPNQELPCCRAGLRTGSASHALGVLPLLRRHLLGDGGRGMFGLPELSRMSEARRLSVLERRVIGIRGRDGAFADFLTLPVANLHQVPDGVSDRCAVFVEPLAAALEILEQTHVRPTDRVVVVGDGRLGLLVAQVLALTGCEIRVLGRHPRKLEILAARGIPVALAESPDLAGWADLAAPSTVRMSPKEYPLPAAAILPEST